MLAANKDLLMAGVKQQATMLRRLELDVIIRRYTSLIAVVSISSGFAFDSLSVIQVESGQFDCFNPPFPPANSSDPCADPDQRGRVQSFFSLYFVTAAIALSCGVFCITTSTFVVNWAQRLAISGANSGQSLEVAVHQLTGFFPKAVIAAACSVLSILIAGFAIIWVKDEMLNQQHVWVATSFIFGIGFLGTAIHCYQIIRDLQMSGYVHGDVQLTNEFEKSTGTQRAKSREVVNQLDTADMVDRASTLDEDGGHDRPSASEPS